jgi:hypothetical protein
MSDVLDDDMISRVELAMCDAFGWPMRNAYMLRHQAIAVIAVMREPNKAMVQAGWPHTADPCWESNVADAWRAMIDAALIDKVS